MNLRRKLMMSAGAFALGLGAGAPMAWADEPLPVVATFSILGDMVERIGGEHIALTTLVGPGGDAHVYTPTPAAARAVSEADVLFMNGLEFEGWLERLSEAASFDGTTVVATTGITPIAFDDDHHDEHDDHGAEKVADDHDDDHDHDHAAEKVADDHDHDHDHDHAAEKVADDHDHDHDHGAEKVADAHDHDDDHDHGHEEAANGHAGHDHGAFDPHAWQSIENAVIYADNIAAGLAKADPENAGDYFQNRAAFVAELEALGAEIETMMAALPEDKRTVVTSHDAFGYFGERYGITFEAPQGISTESEATAADVARLIDQIRDEGITAVFVENISNRRLIDQIASETGVAVGGTLYSDALSEPDGPAGTYLDMMRHNATTLSGAIGS